MSNPLRTVAAFAAFGLAAATVFYGFCLSGESVEPETVTDPDAARATPDAAKRMLEKMPTLDELAERERQQTEARDAERAALIAAHNAPREAKKRPGRRVRRFEWNAADLRGKLWHFPEHESNDALLTAFLRVCLAEADGNPQDCVGIWQVIKNIRRRSCSRDYVRRITECEDGGGETMLSAIKRAQPHILEAPGYRLRNQRAGWIRNVTTDCEVPEGWTNSEARWDARYGSKICPHVVELGRHLIKNELPPSRPGHRLSWLRGRPITWGGRCESGRGSCDDRIACARGLARVQATDTENAFWCQTGRPGCRRDAEPICVQLGYGHLVKNAEQPDEQQQGG